MVKEQSIITSLVELTRLRDQDAIRNKLMSALLEISEASWLVLCRMEREHENPVVEVTNRIPNPSSEKAIQHFPTELFERTELFEGCRDGGTPVWVQDLDNYQSIIFQLPNSSRHHEFVVVFDERVDGRTERIISSVLDLYDNFLGLVIENTQDPLTRLYNRGAFDIDLPATLLRINEFDERRAHPRPQQKRHFLAMMDLDHFKRINDTFGHLYGDEVILIFSSILREQMGDFDRIYRYGGEEFAVILHDITRDEVETLMERLRRAVESYEFPQVGQVTVSIGVAELKNNHLPSSLLDFADQALYHSKDSGRNRVSFFEDMAPTQVEPEAAPGADEDDIFF